MDETTRDDAVPQHLGMDFSALESEVQDPIDVSYEDDSIDIGDDDVSSMFYEPDDDEEREVDDASYEDDSDIPDSLKAKFEKKLAMEKQALEDQYEDRMLAMENQARYGWDNEKTEEFMQYQQEQRNQMFSEVSHVIDELASDPQYVGIKAVEREIQKLIWDNPSLTPEQAYRVASRESPSLVKQLEREANAREVARRSQAKRTVMSDAPNEMLRDDSPHMTIEQLQAAKRLGMTQEYAKSIMGLPEKMDLQQYRNWKQRKGS